MVHKRLAGVAAVSALLTTLAALPAADAAPDHTRDVSRAAVTGARPTQVMTVTAASTWGDVDTTRRITTSAPGKISRVRLEAKVSGRWVHSGRTVGKVVSVTTQGKRKAVAADAVLRLGVTGFRITGVIAGKPVVSNVVRLSGYRWMPLRDAANGHDGDNVVIRDKSLPFLSSNQVWIDEEGDESFDTETVSCRQVEIGIRFDNGIFGGSAAAEFISDRGDIKELTIRTDDRAGWTRLALDGSPMTINLSWSVNDGGDPGDEITWAGNGYCNGLTD